MTDYTAKFISGLESAFITSESGGGNYKLVIKYKTLEELQDAHEALVKSDFKGGGERIDVQAAAALTKQHMLAKHGEWFVKDVALSREHVFNMLEEIIEGIVSGEKAHRYLGWAQAACAMAGVVSMNEARELNRSVRI